jgi:hypothetical protein
MNRIIIDITEEPHGDVYRMLVDIASRRCAYFHLVMRPSLPVDESARAMLKKLQPWLEEERQVSQWPGTVLHGHTATLYLFRLDRQVSKILQDSAEGLYDWIAPRLPEDLCFLRQDRSEWLITIAHEKDAYLHVDPVEEREIRSCVPNLRLST